MLQPNCNDSQNVIIKDSRILQNRCQTIGSLKSAVVGIFIQQKSGNITN